MTPATNRQTSIIRTERGLTIAGTRITLYDVMDHLVQGRSPQLILNWLPLTEAQLEVALQYIEANRAEVEVEYRETLKTAEEVQKYWEERNRERFDRIAPAPPKAERETLWKKLQMQKAKHTSEL
jgi:uncharacterized protein (DUF433 family)